MVHPDFSYWETGQAMPQNRASLARENLKQEREMVSGRYMDVLIKDDGRWKFIAWAGGEDPKK
jgi:hypothetical protein